MNHKWENLLNQFRRLGGIADNICQSTGQNGRGIYPIDSSMKARIFVPEDLFIYKNDIYLSKEGVRIKKDNKYKQDLIRFFNFYQDNFSWGGGGREVTESFEKGLIEFPPGLRALIKENFLVDIDNRLNGIWDNIILREFLNARSFYFKNNSIIAPILELVNHEAKAYNFLTMEKGISTPNYPPKASEITHSYCFKGSVRRVLLYGFFCKESLTFSVPFSLDLNKNGLQIICKGQDLSNDSMMMYRLDKKIIVDGLPIFDINSYNLPLNYLEELIGRLGIEVNVKLILSKIIEHNISTRNIILDELKFINNKTADLLKESIDYEIKNLKYFD